MNKLLIVQCPKCDKSFNYYDSEFRPFCCEKCKMIDLGHWFEESYRVPSKELNPNVNQDEEMRDENQSEGQESNDESYEDDENNY